MAILHLNTPRILLYGLDKVLLDTRRSILRTAGIKAEIATTSEEFSQQIAQAEEPYNLYVLCHSIAAEEQHELGAIAAKSRVKVYNLSHLTTPEEFLKDVRGSLN
jgi:hypothetical protein